MWWDKTAKELEKAFFTIPENENLLGRIKRETKTGSEDISYTYDSNNNRKEMTVGNKVTAYKYNKNDELFRTDTLNTDTEEDSVVIYKYDKNGNQLATVNRYEIPSDKKDSTYVDIDVTLGDNRLNENVVNHYNALNQLTQTLTKNYKVSFTYDAEGLRTSKTVNGEKTVFVWDGDQLVMELSESGKVQKRYIRGNDRGYGSNLVYADKGTDTEKQYYVTDPHGNVVQLTDENGAVTKTYEYDSFGNEVNPDSKDDNSFRYCGEYYDKETGEVYLRARYYQPAVGRFLTRDTYTGEEDDPLSLYLYTYCENDGVNMIDPTGHWGKEDVSNRKEEGLKYNYVHKNITAYAIKKERIYLTKKNLNLFLKGSIAPDKHKAKYFKKYGIEKLSDDMLHGKSKAGLKNLKNQVSKLVKRKKYKKNRYYLMGIALHSIQDYYAHSYSKMPLAKYKEKVSKYYGKNKYAKANKFHSDWAYEYKEMKKKNGNKNSITAKRKELHKENKDNPYKDFVKQNGKWEWVKVDKRMENSRYINACNSSKKFLRKNSSIFEFLLTSSIVNISSLK